MSLKHEISLAVHQKFFISYAKISKQAQKACVEFLKDFKNDPTSSSINYEPINTFKDKQLKTCRINDAYRVIVRAPEKGNTYLILWVDHHDEAMAWAMNKIINLNEHTSAIELIDLTELDYHQDKTEKIFASYSDEQLIKLGISEPIRVLIRLIDSDEALARLQPLIPSQVFSYLYLLKENKAYDEVYALSQSENEINNESISVQTIDEALTLNQNKSEFLVLTDDEELDRYLNASSELWRIFLHPSQRTIVESNVKGSIRVLGGAGTGKTVVAMHRIKWLLENSLEAHEKLLFTTYTKTLTSDLKASLAHLLTPAQLERVVVQNIDQLLHELMSDVSSFKVAYWRPNSTNIDSQKLQAAWSEAMKEKPADMTPEFMRMEWEQVILSQGINSEKAYLKVLRKGRGKTLSASQRKAVWACFEVYINKIIEAQLLEPDMAMWELVKIAVKDGITFPYKAVVLDELQDMSTATLRLLRVLTPSGDNDLFMVGDGHQKIYPRPLSMNLTGIRIQGKGHAHRLRLNYRTTHEIHKQAMMVIQESKMTDLDDQSDALSFYQSLTLGNFPMIHRGGTQLERDQALRSWLEQTLHTLQQAHSSDSLAYQSALKELCVVVRTNTQTEDLRQKLTAWGINSVIVDTHTPLTDELQGVRLMTAHRVKGLEYKGVALVDWSPEYEPPLKDLSGDAEYTAQLKREERSLAYVAMSRARMSLFISYV